MNDPGFFKFLGALLLVGLCIVAGALLTGQPVDTRDCFLIIFGVMLLGMLAVPGFIIALMLGACVVAVVVGMFQVVWEILCFFKGLVWKKSCEPLANTCVS